jgi:hypothetical protein
VRAACRRRLSVVQIQPAWVPPRAAVRIPKASRQEEPPPSRVRPGVAQTGDPPAGDHPGGVPTIPAEARRADELAVPGKIRAEAPQDAEPRAAEPPAASQQRPAHPAGERFPGPAAASVDRVAPSWDSASACLHVCSRDQPGDNERVVIHPDFEVPAAVEAG